MKYLINSFAIVGFILCFLAVKSPNPPTEYHQLGNVVYSVLPLDSFQKQNGKGWMLLDSSDISTSELKTISGINRLPDARGVFIRGMNLKKDKAFGNPDGDTLVGTPQMDALQNHAHKFGTMAESYDDEGQSDLVSATVDGNGYVSHNPYGRSKTSIVPSERNGKVQVSTETRPRNITLYVYIKINRNEGE